MAEIDTYLRFMVSSGASDFHISTGVRPMYRVDGSMIATTTESRPPFEASEVKTMLSEIFPDRSRKEFSDSLDTDFGYEIPELGRFRVNAFVDRHGPGAVVRHIPLQIPTISELGLPTAIEKLCMQNEGLVLVTGPTGSGKTTTLAAMVHHINANRRDHILTIEDPIEFVHENDKCLINQREVASHTCSFEKALRAALREDPDVVLVGELPDRETIELAIETAETGHLVLATLRLPTATRTVDRIIDRFPTDRQEQVRRMLSFSLRGVVSQTLVRKKSGKGRVAAFEILLATAELAESIREGKTKEIPSAIQSGKGTGMQMLNDHLLRLVQQGEIDAEDACAKSVEKQEMATRLETAGFAVEE